MSLLAAAFEELSVACHECTQHVGNQCGHIDRLAVNLAVQRAYRSRRCFNSAGRFTVNLIDSAFGKGRSRSLFLVIAKNPGEEAAADTATDHALR